VAVHRCQISYAEPTLLALVNLEGDSITGEGISSDIAGGQLLCVVFVGQLNGATPRLQESV
jgi:hypothetical protein